MGDSGYDFFMRYEYNFLLSGEICAGTCNLLLGRLSLPVHAGSG